MQQIETPDHTDEGRLARTASDVVRRLVAVGIDGAGPLAPAADAAAAFRERTGSTERAVDALVSSAVRSAAVGGFVTGLGGFVTLPVALPANVLGFYVIATRTVAGVASLRGHDLARPDVRTEVLTTLVEADAQSLLSRLGLGGNRGLLPHLVSSHLPEPAVMVLDKAVEFQIISRFGRTTLSRLGRGVPLAGGLLGAASDALVLQRTAATAREVFSPVAPHPDARVVP